MIPASARINTGDPLSVLHRFSLALPVAVLILLGGSRSGVTEEKEASPSAGKLLAPDFPGDLWTHFSGKKDSPLNETWSVQTDLDAKHPVLVCLGEPYGYLKTKGQFENFEFGLEWRFPDDENGNSGVLLHTTGEDRIWPKSLQIQLHQPVAGSTFPGGGAKSDNELRNVPMLTKPINQWNACVITSVDGQITVQINGQKVGKVTGCDPAKGAIALQSEGSEIHFRNIWIKELPAKTAH